MAAISPAASPAPALATTIHHRGTSGTPARAVVPMGKITQLYISDFDMRRLRLARLFQFVIRLCQWVRARARASSCSLRSLSIAT